MAAAAAIDPHAQEVAVEAGRNARDVDESQSAGNGVRERQRIGEGGGTQIIIEIFELGAQIMA